MEKIEKDYGAVILSGGKIYGYEGGHTDNGFVFKDYEAFKSGQGICYISEHELEALDDDLADLEARYENSEMTREEYWEERSDILANCGETRKTIIDQVREAFGYDYLLTEEQVEWFAWDVFGLADWACIGTYLAENFDIEDSIEFDHDKGTGLYTQLQYDAVMAGKYPRDYEKEMQNA